MSVLYCKMCGGTIEFEPSATVGVCDYCGTKQTLPKVNDDNIANLFNRANNLRLKCEFDKAEQIYEKIVQQNDSEAEAHWGIILCKYGVEYVEDPKTLERIPTCHRTRFESIKTDADYEAAIDYSDALQQGIYEKEARQIDKLQKDILAIVKNEKPFDVFICYKEKDENGKRTVDSALANDIYYQLTQTGLKVFYAAITLEDKLGQEYEPYIFSALNSAKVMLVIGTKPEYLNAVWVKNEWSRFMNQMKTDRSKILIPCYRDMDAYDLPEEFAHLQAQDMSRIGFIQDIIRGVEKVASRRDKTKDSFYDVGHSTKVDSGETIEKLKNLKELYDEGVISEEEFNGLKRQLLSIGQPESNKKLKKREESFSNSKPIDYISDTEVRLNNFDGDSEWLVLDRNEDKYLLISKYCQYRHIISDTPSYYWEKSHVRNHLNNEFINRFTLAQRSLIIPADESGMDNADVHDRVFLLSIDEFNKYKHILKKYYAWRDSKVSWEWALRTGGGGNGVAVVPTKKLVGDITPKYARVQTSLGASPFGIRPAIWIDMSKTDELINAEITSEMNASQIVEERDNQVKTEIERIASDIEIHGDEVILNGFDGQNEWIVLKKSGDNWLLLSKYMQECREVQKYIPYVWEDSQIREYLNTEFVNRFTSNQKDRLQIPSLCDTKDISDKIFLMSEDEYNIFFSSKEDDRRIMRRKQDMFPEIWALRSMDKKGRIQFVTKDGYINSKDGNSLFAGVSLFGIRPLIWLNVSTE